jgi:hypothetical protein
MNKKKKKKIKKMNVSEALEGREGNVGDLPSIIDLVMAANTNESKEINENENESCVDSNDITKKGAEIFPDIVIEENMEQEKWDYTNKCNEWEGGDFCIDEEHNQNGM